MPASLSSLGRDPRKGRKQKGKMGRWLIGSLRREESPDISAEIFRPE